MFWKLCQSESVQIMLGNSQNEFLSKAEDVADTVIPFSIFSQILHPDKIGTFRNMIRVCHVTEPTSNTYSIRFAYLFPSRLKYIPQWLIIKQGKW